MATVKLPPRQKMINMMYLVLTAILALNVSKEVLDSFVRLDLDLVRSERAHELRSATEYASFERSAAEIPEKYREPFAQAAQIRGHADSLVGHIERLKAMVIAECEGLPMEQVFQKNISGGDSLMAIAEIQRKDDRDALTYMLVGSEPAAPKQGVNTASDLKARVETFREQLKSVTGDREPRITAALDRLFDLADQRDASGTLNNWESLNFYDVPVVAGIASLSKLQADVRSAENDVIKWLHNSVEADIYKVDRLMAAVIPQSDHVLVGDSFRADVFLAAYDSRNSPEIFFGDGRLDIGPDGRARLCLPAGALGEQKGEGMIRFKGPNGPMEFPYVVDYQVIAPTLVASPTKMNVLYRFVENPVELSVPGVTGDRVAATITNGGIVRGRNGEWVAKPGAASTAEVYAAVTLPEGGTRRIGPVHFRVKDLPPPAAFIAGKTSTDRTIRKSELIAVNYLIARLVDSEFDVKFKVTSFELQIYRGASLIPHTVNGNTFDEDIKEAFKAMRANDQVIIQHIRARLESGEGRSYDLPPIALKVVS